MSSPGGTVAEAGVLDLEDPDLLSRENEDAWFELYRFFESRKALRLYGGKRGIDRRTPMMSIGTVVLWILAFGLTNVELTKNSLTFEFADLSVTEPISISLYIGSISLNIISLIIIMISVMWGVSKIIPIQFAIMLLSTVVTFCLNRTINPLEVTTLKLATLITTFMTATLLADVLLYYTWTAYLLPPIFRWRKHCNDDITGGLYSSVLFPYFELSVAILLLTVLLPLWIPCLASYFLVLLLQIVGVRIVNRSVLEFLILNRASYETFKCTAIEEGENHDFTVVFHLRLKETISWRFWRCNQLPLSSFSYTGTLNTDGLPNGAGTWSDVEDGGEILSGHWLSGRPVAPFESREQRSNGGSFSCVNIAFFNTGSLYRVEHSTSFRPPQYGLASVECGRSGAFYDGFPEARLVLTPSFDSMLQSCLQMAQAAGKVGTITDTNNAASAAAGGGGGGIRIIVYVCGFNNSCEAACKMYGQMLALSRYPPTFLHLLYSWPGGNLASYVQARHVCESLELEDEFFSFVARLRACPEVSSVDLIGHSQGCRLLTNCMSKPRMLALKIRHLILASPEVDLDTFRANAGSITANITGGVTVYTHPGDMALFWAQLVNTVAVQPHWHYKKSLGRCTKAIKTNTGEGVRGVDVIDTSSLMSNVEELHHSFFYLSREMLEDMRTLLVEDVLASGRRERLLVQRHEGASVYDFCSVPSGMKSIW